MVWSTFFLHFQIDILIFLVWGELLQSGRLTEGVGWVGQKPKLTGRFSWASFRQVQVQNYRGSKITCSCRGILTWWSLGGKRFPVEVAGIEIPEPRLKSGLISTTGALIVVTV